MISYSSSPFNIFPNQIYGGSTHCSCSCLKKKPKEPWEDSDDEDGFNESDDDDDYFYGGWTSKRKKIIKTPHNLVFNRMRQQLTGQHLYSSLAEYKKAWKKAFKAMGKPARALISAFRIPKSKLKRMSSAKKAALWQLFTKLKYPASFFPKKGPRKKVGVYKASSTKSFKYKDPKYGEMDLVMPSDKPKKKRRSEAERLASMV
jgi:hypothetical protein